MALLHTLSDEISALTARVRPAVVHLQVLRRVIIPAVRPGVVAGCILVFIPSLGAYITPRILGGGKSMMLGNLIAEQFGPARNWPLGSAMALFLMLVVMIALVVYVRNVTKKEAQNV